VNPYEAQEYSMDLGNGFRMNPRTGAVLDMQTNQVHGSPDQMGASISSQGQQEQQGQGQQSGGSNPAGAATGAIGTGLTGYSGYNALYGGSPSVIGSAPSTPTIVSSGGQALAQGGSQAIAEGGSQAVGSAMNGGTMMANGSVAPMTTGTYGGATTGAGYLGNVGSVMPWLGVGANAYQIGNEAKGGYERQQQQGGGFGTSIKNEGSHQVSKPMLAMAAVNPYMWFLGAQAALGGAGAGSLFGSSKAPERMARKEARKRFQDVGLMNKDSRSRYNLADGGQFDISKYRQETGKQAFNIDHEEAGAGDKVGRLNAITSALIGSGKVKRDLTGELYNAYNSNGNFDQNFRGAADQVGGRDVIYQGIADRWKNDKKFTVEDRDAAFAAIDKEYGIANPTNSRWDASLTGKDAERNQKEMAKAQQAQGNKPAAGVAAPVIAPSPFGPLAQNAKPIPKGGVDPRLVKPAPTRLPYKNPRFK